MSGIFSAGGAGNVGVSGFYPVTIEDSLRFEDGSSAYLNRTPSSTGNRKTWTFSCWLKGAYFAGSGTIFSTSQNYDSIRYTSTGNFMILLGNGSANLETTALFRDPSAWYNLVAAVDTTQSTSTDRVKLYVNGSQITSFITSNYPSLNYDTGFNHTSYSNAIGRRQSTSSLYWDGYLSNIHFIDGQALDPTSFGEAKDGTWIPKSYAGSYGTNGFHLEFNGNTNDTSGNSNNWTATNISAHDYVPDSPTNNFAVLNAVDTSTYCTLSEGNTKIASTSGAYWGTTRSTFAVDSGKWYWETCVTADQYARIGILGLSTTLSGQTSPYLGLQSDGYAYYGPNGYIYNNNSGSAYGASYTAGDVIGIALDLDGGTLTFYKNGTSQGTAATGLSGSFAASISVNTGSVATTVAANFGQDSTFAGNITAGGNADGNGVGDFKYSVPSGYLALCTANLQEPTIIDGSEHFNTVLWTGNGSTQSITGVGFQPDVTWIKSRNAAYYHRIMDSVRGISNALYTNSADSEGTFSAYDGLTSFDADGFTSDSKIGTNETGTTYVGWNWKAGTAFSNSAGANGATIASSGSVNTDAGFSIVSYTGSTSESVGHGLGQAPECIFVKDRDVSSSWAVYHQGVQDVTTNGFLELNSTYALQTGSNPRFLSGTAGTSQPTSTVFYVNNYSGSSTNNTGNDYIAYCFHSVDGYSKVGSYTGNGSSDGTFVYTGFRPAWIMFKGATVSSHWLMFDVARHPSNVNDLRLFANLTNGDDSAYALDLLSNGFKLRHTGSDFNASGQTFIFLAFAESPFKYANAR